MFLCETVISYICSLVINKLMVIPVNILSSEKVLCGLINIGSFMHPIMEQVLIIGEECSEFAFSLAG